MRILLASPLYPPDIAEPAPYVKELARRLAANHEVTVLTYGSYPEGVAGVRIIAIDKRTPRLTRMWAFARALRTELRRTDILYVENGASVELPVLLATFGSRVPFILHLGDGGARARARHSLGLGLLFSMVERRAKNTIQEHPLPRPEVLPFTPLPTAARAEYEESWRVHLALVTNALSYGT